MRAYILLGGFLIGFLSLVLAQEQENKFLQIVDSVLYSNHNKLEYNDQLKILLYQSLTKSAKEIQSFDSNGLIYELQDEKARLQILSWAIQISDKWEYFAYVKSYNEPRKKYVVWELLAFDLWEPQYYNSKGDADNWPGAVYYKLIEKEYRDRKYYTLLGWLPEKNQTAFKVIEVLTISKSGRLSFGKSSYFSVDKTKVE
ncbi:MAG: hypothetical protein B7C24_12960 [Bacteroidetes bacterium 4572_77]|nr:MAG: hypothetical protein B7C24_12960 [Bacteroidetes bacterium 4572_77]